MTALDLQPFLTYPAVIKLRHKGEQKSFDSPQKAEDFISSLSQKTTYTVAPQGNGERRPPTTLFGPAGGAWLKMPSCFRERMVAGWTWIPVESLLFSFLSPPGMLFLFVRRNCLFTGETNSPLFFWRGLVESGLDCSVFFFGYVGLLGGSSCVGVDRSWIINIFCCSIRPMFSVTCDLSCLLL